MPLSPGTRVGNYEILSKIGEGGMGEVYRGRDTRLKREVAIKTLPDALKRDPDRIARFEREAQTLAALNHPNIAIIHGVEDAGHDQALVMELVEGETLAELLANGGLPADDVRTIALQIADALEAAHEQSVIHRDLKPANIKIRPDGTVKVLDFGLAKIFAAREADSQAPRRTVSPVPDVQVPDAERVGALEALAHDRRRLRPGPRRDRHDEVLRVLADEADRPPHVRHDRRDGMPRPAAVSHGEDGEPLLDQRRIGPGENPGHLHT